MDNVKAPNCPVCGKFMDKVNATVTAQLSASGTAVVGQNYVAWVCVPCNK